MRCCYGLEMQIANDGPLLAVGSLNNRAEKRDDGLRQDRHPNRTRGMHNLESNIPLGTS